MTEVQRAGIYARLSRNRDGLSDSVTLQLNACRKLAAERSWPVAQEFVDDDLSAFNARRRPGYEALLSAVTAGDVDAIIARHPDRLQRSPRELEDFIDLIEKAGIPVETVHAGRVDLASRSGRTTARIIGAMARDESEAKSERLRAKHAQLAADGRWSGGPRPYGYRPSGSGRLEVVEAEAEVVREAAHRVLGGESVGAVCEDLNRRAVPTARGARWRPPTLRRILTSPGAAGQRLHKGEVVAEAQWPPLLDELTLRSLRRAILDPARSTGRRARVALLAGMLWCGRCSGRLVTQRRGTGVRVYVCLAGGRAGGCGRLSVTAEPLEELLAETVISLVDQPALARRLVSQRSADRHDPLAALENLIGDLDRRLLDLAEMFAAGEIDRAEWTAAHRPLRTSREQALASVARNATPDLLLRAWPAPGALRTGWPELSLDRRRAIVAAVVSRVVVHPATRRGPGFDPDRVDVFYADDEKNLTSRSPKTTGS